MTEEDFRKLKVADQAMVALGRAMYRDEKRQAFVLDDFSLETIEPKRIRDRVKKALARSPAAQESKGEGQ